MCRLVVIVVIECEWDCEVEERICEKISVCEGSA